MNVTAETRVRDLIDEYPYLLDWLAAYDAEFERLRNPVFFNTLARAATLKQAAALGHKQIDAFLDDIRTEIARREIAAEERAGGPSSPAAPDRARRQEILKDLIRELHDGASVGEVKARFDELVAEVDAAEIAAMEQALIAEGLPIEEVQRLCDVHVTVFKDALAEDSVPSVPEDHPVATYRRENEMAAEITNDLRCHLDELAGLDGQAAAIPLGEIASGLENLAQIDRHYLRKENQLFPLLEQHDIVGPTQVMWALDDQIRERISADLIAARELDRTGVIARLGETLGMVDDMVFKEEKILFPLALEHLTGPEWARVAEGEHEVGFSWIEPPQRIEGARMPDAAVGLGALPLPTGTLSLGQLDLLFRALPFDLTFVDENDRVRFYSEGMRVFHRTPAAIGREVRRCHPPASVDKVERILGEFKAGTKDVAEFWIRMGERFVWIRYFALRDAEGTYQGCLEVVQDATHVRSLEGERRLLDW